MRQIFFVSMLLGLTGAITWQLTQAPDLEADDRAFAAEGGEVVLHAEDIPFDRSPLEGRGAPVVTSYADVLDEVRPAVVSVTTARVVRVMRGGAQSPLEEMLRRFYGLPQAPEEGEVEERRLPAGLGSGVIVSADGYILTNSHVVSDERGSPVDEIRVVLQDEREFEATLVGRDPQTDIAVLKIEAEELPTVPMADSDALRVGDVVFAIGNPLGVGQTVTMGIVSATGRSDLGLLGSQGYENFIQTDASINPGNSGGALVDAAGRLIGINTAILSRTGGNIGIGFAIPSVLARSIMLNLVNEGTVRRGYLGVEITDLTPELAEAFGLEDSRGVLIQGVQDGFPAQAAGLERGDVIRAVDGEPVRDVTELRLLIAERRPGVETELTYFRDGEVRTVQLTLASVDGPMGEGDATILEGVTLGPVTSTVRQDWSVAPDVTGVAVLEVEAGSPYVRSLREGMILREVNDLPIKSMGDLRRALLPGRVNKLWVWVEGSEGYIALRMRR